MKRCLAIAVLALSTMPAMAQHHHGHHGGYHGHRGGNWGWGPVLGGAIAGAVIYDIYNRPVVIQQPPVVVQPQPVYQYPQPVQNCTPWTETQNPNGTITRTRTCTQ